MKGGRLIVGHRLMLPVVASTAVALAGCSSSHHVRAPLPPPPQVVHVTITDQHYQFDAGIHAGRTVFVAHNTGRAMHSIQLFPVADDVPPVDEQIHGDRRIQVVHYANVQVKAGATTTFAVDLAPKQRYFMLDFNFKSGTRVWALDGLNAEFRAT